MSKSNEQEKDKNEEIESTEDKAKQNAEDTVNMAKDTAKLAKDVSTGNVLGIVKNAISLLKNKKFRKMLLVTLLMPIVTIVLAGAFILGIFEAVADTVGGIVGGIGKGIAAIGDFLNPSRDELKIEINDETLDDIINEIDKLGVSIDGLKLMGDVDYTQPNVQEENKKALRKYLKKFYEAQAMTQVLNTNPNWQQSISNDIYGNVYVCKSDNKDVIDASSTSYLTYKKYEDMEEMKQKNDSNIINYFSMDQEGKLVYAGLTEKNIDGNKTTQIELYHENYIDLIGKYTTPVSFYLDLVMISQNPEFVSAVADMAKLSKINITIMYDVRTVTTITTEKYTENTKKVVENNKKYEKKVDTKAKENTTKTVTTTKIPKLAVTYVKSWYGEQSMTYNKVKDAPVSSNNKDNPTELPDETEPEDLPLEEEYKDESVTWKTNRTEVTEITEDYTGYDEGIRGEVIDRIGEKGSQGLNNSNKVDENTTFIGLLEQKFKIPNSTREDRAGDNLVSGAQMLFHLLEKNPELQNVEQWMRYALNKYTDSNRYGDIEFSDLANEFTTGSSIAGTNFVVDTSKGDASICITDAQVLKDAVSKIYTGKREENLTNEAQSFIDMQAKYHVNAVFAMAVTIAESGGGTVWNAIDSSTYNWYSITGSYNGKSYKNPASSNPHEWRVYSSFKEATFDFGDLIANSSYYYKAGKYTVEEIATTYCDETWGRAVISYMSDIYKAAGIELQGEGFIEGGVTTDEQAKELKEKIEKELIHTQVHEKDYMYQNGPFAKWWINRLEPFQCTWWANGRASMYLEQHGTKYKTGYPTLGGNGGEYYDINKANGWFKYGQTPKPNSIISWRNGGYGHVAYVEGVSKDGIYISHAGAGYSWYGIEKIPLDGSIKKWSGYKLNGYIYLDEPN